MHLYLAGPLGPTRLAPIAALDQLRQPIEYIGLNERAIPADSKNSVTVLDFRHDLPTLVRFAQVIRRRSPSLGLVGIFSPANLFTVSPEWGLTDIATETASARELEIRLLRALPRNQRNPGLSYTSHRPAAVFVLDPDSRSLVVSGESINLTPWEYRLISLLMAQPTRAFRRSELTRTFTHAQPEIGPAAVNIRVARLRRKLGRHAYLVRTVRGVGYQLVPADPARAVG